VDKILKANTVFETSKKVGITASLASNSKDYLTKFTVEAVNYIDAYRLSKLMYNE
jgi:hypothetical protein